MKKAKVKITGNKKYINRFAHILVKSGLIYVVKTKIISGPFYTYLHNTFHQRIFFLKLYFKNLFAYI